MALTRTRSKEKENQYKAKITWKEIKRQKVLLFWSGVMVIYGIIFYYLPLAGWAMAFQNYKPKLGIFHSEFVGLQKFQTLFSDMTFIRVKIKYVTLPGIKPTIMILLLMNVGNVLNAGFEIQYLLGNGLVQKVSQTIDIYVLKWGISQGDYSIGTAAGIFKSAVSIILIVIANQIAKRNGEERLF